MCVCARLASPGAAVSIHRPSTATQVGTPRPVRAVTPASLFPLPVAASAYPPSTTAPTAAECSRS